MPEAPRPGARATATPSRRKGALTLPRLLLAAAGLLLIAYFAGKRPSGPRPADPAPTAARPAPTAHPTAPATARVIPGRKSTTLAQVGEAGMSASQDGRVLRIEGGVGRNFAADLQQQLERNPSLQRIEITSGGGYASTGLAAARLIRKRNLIVKVRAYCASVCVALWAAAAQRQMEPDAVIGLHQWNPQCEALPSPHREECRYQAQFATEHASSYDGWLRSAGFNRYLLDLQKTTAAEDIAVLDVLQLWDNGVEFSVTDAAGTTLGRTEVERHLAQRQRRG